MASYPKRLIEVDLPIKRISAHARREKSIRHGHISTLHIWWARRPLAACRAVICASLWPDPADELCPQAFRDKALECIKAFAQKVVVDPKLAASCHPETMGKYLAISGRVNGDAGKPGKDGKKKQMPTPELNSTDPAHLNILRYLLLDFIADFANWDNSTVPEYLETSRALTQVAHEALGGMPETKPLVVDPFAGGGAIPLEALRVGADAFASDLNPVAVLLNKVVLEYIPKYGQRLADEVHKWGGWLKEEAEKELAEFYPRDPDGAIPIAYLWARTIRCEGPGCGAEVPLIRQMWLAKKGRQSVALELISDKADRRVDFEIIKNASAKDVSEGTVKRGSATCPCCGYTTRVESVRRQLKERRGGAADSRLLAVVTMRRGEQGRFYRLPTKRDLEAAGKAAEEMNRRSAEFAGPLSLVPDEVISPNELRRISIPIYGMTTWGDLFAPRQALALTTLTRLVRELGPRVQAEHENGIATALQACLGLAVDRLADFNSSIAHWANHRETSAATFGRQALGMAWDYCETAPMAESTGSLSGSVQWFMRVCESGHQSSLPVGAAHQASATKHPMPSDSAAALITDPPYYDAVPYAHLSDFFYVWLRRMLGGTLSDLFATPFVDKDAEIVVDRPHAMSTSTKDVTFYERELCKAFAEGRRVLRPDGIGTIVFASKTTASWEAILQAVVSAGWTITGSWPIDTEMETRVAAQGQARLGSSVHLVCRPRENADGSLRADSVGDWREVLHELPTRIHEWMPRLAHEGVVGADAIFACLGPALEIFSRYSRVEKASGEQVILREYLEEVWAVVSREALNMIFEGADATGFEEDARITAMWLWTLSTEANGNGSANGTNGSLAEPEDSSDDDEEPGSTKQAGGYTLEFDAARKIAQGLGVHLERLDSVVETKGEIARLLPVSERAVKLFGKDELDPAKKTKKRSDQLRLDGMLDIEQESDVSVGLMAVKSGETTLDRVHQSMLLFSAGRSEALQRFLVEDGIGRDQRFWKLAQALSALYPKDSDEKRWVDGVLARKKGLGF